MNGSVLIDKLSCKMLGLYFSSKSEREFYIASTAKTVSKEIKAFICSVKFLFPVLNFHFYKPTIQPCVEYCCHVWVDTPNHYFDVLGKLQKRNSWDYSSFTCASIETLAHRQNATSLSLIYRYYFHRC